MDEKTRQRLYEEQMGRKALRKQLEQSGCCQACGHRDPGHYAACPKKLSQPRR